jgi:branched-chain amino acid transport system ATP-binding protein
MTALLRVEGVDVGYGHVGVLQSVSLEIAAGSIVALVGSNGAGKSTLLRAISGLLRPKSGRILFDGKDIAGLRPDRIVDAGVLHVAEGRRLFHQQSVADNLELGLYGTRLDRAAQAKRHAHIYDLFPVLAERRGARAGVLSGGQQQMLAIGQALMRDPRLLMLDEPSLGLASRPRALEIADYAYVLQNGRMAGHGPASELATSDLVKNAYVGVA